MRSLQTAIPYVYGDSMQRDVQDKDEVVLHHMDPLYISDKNERAHDNMSIYTVAVEMAGEQVSIKIWMYSQTR